MGSITIWGKNEGSNDSDTHTFRSISCRVMMSNTKFCKHAEKGDASKGDRPLPLDGAEYGWHTVEEEPENEHIGCSQGQG